MSDVGIAGAGIAGRLLAWQLARLGHEVDVFDPAPDAQPPGAGESHDAAAFTAAGMLSPLAELENAPPEVAERGWRSLELWPGIVAALGPQYRTPGLFRRNGSVLVAHPRDAGAAERVLARMNAAQIKGSRERRQALADSPDATTLQVRSRAFELDAEEDARLRRAHPLAVGELASLEPALAPGLHGWHLPGEGQVDTSRLLPALCAEAPGVRWHWRSRVDHVEPRTLHLGDRSLRFDVVVDTRGLGAREALALRGVRGELVWLHAPGVELRRPVRAIHARHRVYLVPRRDDLIIVGATEIDSEDRSPVSVRSTIELLSAAHSVLPQLAEARIVRLAAHLRPATPDQHPHVHCEPGLIRINGLFRHGFLLAPALAEEALQRSGLMESALRRETNDA